MELEQLFECTNIIKNYCPFNLGVGNYFKCEDRQACLFCWNEVLEKELRECSDEKYKI